jgi:hypothetical protein
MLKQNPSWSAKSLLVCRVDSGHRSGIAVLDFHHGFHARKAWQRLTESRISGFNLPELKLDSTVEDTMCARPRIALEVYRR